MISQRLNNWRDLSVLGYLYVTERLRAHDRVHVAGCNTISTQRRYQRPTGWTDPATPQTVAFLRPTTTSGLLGRKIFHDQCRRRRRLLFAGL